MNEPAKQLSSRGSNVPSSSLRYVAYREENGSVTRPHGEIDVLNTCILNSGDSLVTNGASIYMYIYIIVVHTQWVYTASHSQKSTNAS